MARNMHEHITARTAQLTGTFFCPTCRLERPLDMKVKRGFRILCATCRDRQTKPKEMKNATE